MKTIIIKNFESYRIKRKYKGDFYEAIFEGDRMVIEEKNSEDKDLAIKTKKVYN